MSASTSPAAPGYDDRDVLGVGEEQGKDVSDEEEHHVLGEKGKDNDYNEGEQQGKDDEESEVAQAQSECGSCMMPTPPPMPPLATPGGVCAS